MTYDQQCTRCLTKRQFQALRRVINYMWEKEQKDYLSDKATYGDMVNQPNDHIFLELQRLKNYTFQISEEM